MHGAGTDVGMERIKGGVSGERGGRPSAEKGQTLQSAKRWDGLRACSSLRKKETQNPGKEAAWIAVSGTAAPRPSLKVFQRRFGGRRIGMVTSEALATSQKGGKYNLKHLKKQNETASRPRSGNLSF